VRDGQSLHEAGELAIVLGPEHQVPVIAHEAITTHRYGLDFQSVVKDPEERGVVGRRFKEVHPANAAVKDVIDQLAGCFAGGSGHGESVSNESRTVKNWTRPDKGV